MPVLGTRKRQFGPWQLVARKPLRHNNNWQKSIVDSAGKGVRMRRTYLTVAGLGLVFSFATANGDDSSECLVSLAASAPGATTSRGGQMITATADTSGKCTF